MRYGACHEFWRCNRYGCYRCDPEGWRAMQRRRNRLDDLVRAAAAERERCENDPNLN